MFSCAYISYYHYTGSVNKQAKLIASISGFTCHAYLHLVQ